MMLAVMSRRDDCCSWSKVQCMGMAVEVGQPVTGVVRKVKLRKFVEQW